MDPRCHTEDRPQKQIRAEADYKEGQPHNQRIVTVGNAIDEPLSESGDAEDLFDDKASDKDVRKERPQIAQDR